MNLIFDFDGTICDSLKAAVKIANFYLEKEGRDKVTVKRVREQGVTKLVQESQVPKYKIVKLLILGRKDFKKNILTLKIFKNLPEVLRNLSKNNELGILTTNSRENVQIFLKNNNLRVFNFIHSEIDIFGKASKLKKVIKKYNFDPKQTAYLGDETRDIAAAKKAGVKSICVSWGYESKAILKKSRPDFIADNPKDLREIEKLSLG